MIETHLGSPKSFPRLASIDCLRLLAILAVATGHFWNKDSIVRAATYSWHVPMFFFLTGYLWSSTKTLRLELHSRSKSLLVPYICWLVALETVFFCSDLVKTRAFQISRLFDMLHGGIRLTGTFAAFWFTPVLFLSIVIIRLAYVHFRRFYHVIVLGASVSSIVICTYWNHIVTKMPLDLFMAIPCCIFILAGQFLHWLEARLSTMQLTLIGFVSTSVSILLFVTGLCAPLDIKYGIFGTPILSMVMSIALCGGMVILTREAIDRHIAHRFAQIVTRLAYVILPVMFVHLFAFLVYGHLGLSGIGLFSVAVVSSFLVGLALNLMPLFSPLFVGIPRWKFSTNANALNL